MCGIVGFSGKKNCLPILLGGLEKLEYRGYDSAGVAVFNNGRVTTVKTQGRLALLRDKLAGGLDGNCGIGHTRWATHGAPSDVNSHPHGTERLTLVHNGIIENYSELKKELAAKGYTFVSQTDTEVAAKLLDSCYDGDPVSSIRRAVSRIRGSYALAILFFDHPGIIYALRQGSPLIAACTADGCLIASDIPAILEYTRDFYLPEEGEILEAGAEKIKFYDAEGKAIQKKTVTANWSAEAAEKNGYDHFMLKEIYEQPEVVALTIKAYLSGDCRLNEKPAKRLLISACGTAMHAGIAAKQALEELAGIPVVVDIASEFRYRSPVFCEGDQFIVISQSGETADSLAALRLAKKAGVPTICLVNVQGSTIAREADHVLYTYAGPEIAVASTKAYNVQLAALFAVSIDLAVQNGKLSKSTADGYLAELAVMPEKIKQVLTMDAEIAQAAKIFNGSDHCFFIGRGMDYAAAQESSLKLKEISYIHSEACAAGELKHGTISLITEGTPVIALATQPRLWEKSMSNILEVRARGGSVLLICPQNAVVPEGAADFVLRIPDCNPLFSPMLALPLMQLYAYHSALFRGCDVDKPRNLAKSVTVE